MVKHNTNLFGHLVLWTMVAFIAGIVLLFAPYEKDLVLTENLKSALRAKEVSYEYLGKKGLDGRDDQFDGDSFFHFENRMGKNSIYRVQTEYKSYVVEVSRSNKVVQSKDVTTVGEAEAFKFFKLN